MVNSNQPKDNNEAWIAQLTQLNERSRWYSSQLWQIPFAFLSLVAITIGTVIDKGTTKLIVALLILFFIGVFIIWHMSKLADSEQLAVDKLNMIEEKLFSDITKEILFCKIKAEKSPTWVPFMGAVCFATLAIAGIIICLIR